MRLREGMNLQKGERVEVYYNLHQGGFSIKSLDRKNPHKGRVVAYAPYVQIENATFHVSRSKLDRILEIQQKQVCAVVRGYFLSTDPLIKGGCKLREGYYNPYVTKQFFVDKKSWEPIHHAAFVYFYDRHFSYLSIDMQKGVMRNENHCF